MKVNSSDQDLVLGGQLGILYKLSSTLQLGVFGDISSKNSKLTSIISVHVGLLGFNFKVPFFCGTQTEGPSGTFWDSGLAVTLGIFGIANAFTFGAYKTYRKFKRIKKYSKLDVDFTKFQEKMKRFKDEETKLEENMRRNRNLENTDLIIIDAIMGHKAHIRQIVKGQKRFEEPLATAEQYNHCQVYRIKSKLQSMVQNNSLTISENIIFEEPEIFNPRRYHGDISVYVTFRFRGFVCSFIHNFSSKQDMRIANVQTHPFTREFT
eukprot:CAMPEP_0197000382 /NCGR_PEP_ID=MMETSP1380-20130617/5343_1 /TAXON_ID=5936 /ORGANISM="Euplotes crassus, Strain CT5" /LENGTH=264 /DNA_ID=CAMNT_0042417661 /DNA_START=721 /DNA_END=1511 /DNA_ORIENTATION=+